MRLTVFGATGRTGGPLVRQALDRGHEVVAFAREPDDIGVGHERLTVVAGDAYTGEGVEAAIAGSDAVLSVLGQTSDGPDDLQTVAGRHILDAMREAGVDRFVTLTGAGVRHERDTVGLSGRVIGLALKLLAREVLADARQHVTDVRDSDCRWTVVRAPRLTEGDYTGSYRHGYLSLGVGDSISRADLAEFLLSVVENDSYVYEMPLVSR